MGEFQLKNIAQKFWNDPGQLRVIGIQAAQSGFPRQCAPIPPMGSIN